MLRGRRGTEAAAGRHAAGDRFVLLAGDAIRTLDVPLASLGSEIRVMATGLSDDGGPVEARLTLRGASVVPPAPVQLGWTATADGGAVVRWTRRSRSGWRWIDRVDAPLVEEAEAYRVTETSNGGGTRTGDTQTAEWTVEAATLAGGPVSVSVRQRGTHGESAAAVINVKRGMA